MPRTTWGHIEYLGPEKYRIHWYDDTGTKRSRRINGSHRVAEEALAAARLERDYKPPITWGAYYEETVRPSFKGLEEHTIYGYERSWNSELKDRIQKHYVQDANFHFCQAILDQIETPSAQRHAKALWRKMCYMAVHDELLQGCPIDRSTKLKPRNKRKKHMLSAAKVFEFLKNIEGMKYKALALMELGGGLGHEEACAMVKEKIKRVEINGRVYAVLKVDMALTVVKGKKVLKGTKNHFREREVVIGEPFATPLLELAEGEGPFYPGPLKVVRGGYREANFASPQVATRNWSRWCENNDNVDYIRFGDMRSIFSTWHGEAGSPDSLVSMSMGHSDGTTKGDNYQMATRRGLVLIADSLTDYLNGADLEVYDW